MYFAVFANNIWSYLLWSPVIVCGVVVPVAAIVLVVLTGAYIPGLERGRHYCMRMEW